MTNSCAAIAPVVERTLGKGEVACSNHASSTIFSLYTINSIYFPDVAEAFELCIHPCHMTASDHY